MAVEDVCKTKWLAAEFTCFMLNAPRFFDLFFQGVVAANDGVDSSGAAHKTQCELSTAQGNAKQYESEPQMMIGKDADDAADYCEDQKEHDMKGPAPNRHAGRQASQTDQNPEEIGF
jgi:hypothetical protein